MSDTVKKGSESIVSSANKTFREMETFFNVLLKMITSDREQYYKALEFLNKIKENNEIPVYVTVNETMAKRMLPSIEKKGIPYEMFTIDGSDEVLFLIREENRQLFKDIEGGIRVQAGLEIDTVEEFRHALNVQGISTEYRITGLTDFEAQKIIDDSNDDRHRYAAAMQRMKDGTYTVVCGMQHKELANKALFDAIVFSTFSSQTSKVVKANSYYKTLQKQEFLAQIETFREYGNMQEAYILSADNPERYIHIKPYGFEVIEGNATVVALDSASCPGAYADILKLYGMNVPNMLYVAPEELYGINSNFNVAKKEYIEDARKNSMFTDIKFPEYELKFKNWLREQVNTSNGYLYNHPESFDRVNPERYFETHKVYSKTGTLLEIKAEFALQMDEIKKRIIAIRTEAAPVKIKDTNLLIKIPKENKKEDMYLENVTKGAYTRDNVEAHDKNAFQKNETEIVKKEVER